MSAMPRSSARNMTIFGRGFSDMTLQKRRTRTAETLIMYAMAEINTNNLEGLDISEYSVL